MNIRPKLACSIAWVALAVAASVAQACPFCSAVSMTLAEELKASDAAVIARLVDKPPAATSPDAKPAKCSFEIVSVLKGQKLLGNRKTVEMLFFGQQEPGTKFLLFGIDPKDLAWGTPTALTDRSIKYLETVAKLPESPTDRLAFFQEYLEDEDSLLSGDAFNEFAKTAYPDVSALAPRMHRDRLLTWINDPKVPASRRRLYFTMLSACGKPDDVAMLETMIKVDDRQTRTALDAMIGCYLSLKGVDGLPLIEDMFLKNAKCEYVDTYSAIVALRVLGQETKVIPKDRLVAALRYMLDRPQLADLVIPDLARWQDWSAMDRLVDLFKNANEESSWVRVPVVQYLKQCPEPKAKKYLEELAKIDPDSVKRANSLFPLNPGPAAPAAAATAAKTDAKPEVKAAASGSAAAQSPARP